MATISCRSLVNPNARACFAGILILIVAFGVGCDRAEQSVPAKPNVLFIIFDDLNFQSVEGIGRYANASTPNLERLAQAGTRFTNAHTNAPLCAPSRASMLSGLYPHTSGYFTYVARGTDQPKTRFRQNPVLRGSKTLMEHFKENGYWVGGTGKIFHHMDRDTTVWINSDGEYAFGIDPDYGPYPSKGTGEGNAWRMGHPNQPACLNAVQCFGSLQDIPVIPPGEEYPGYKGWMLKGEPFHYNADDDRDLMPDEQSAAWVVSQLRRDLGKPFLMMVGFNRPHMPLYAPQKYFDLFPLDSIPLFVEEGDFDDCGQVFKEEGSGTTDFGFRKYQHVIERAGKEGLKAYIQAYLASVAFADAQLGIILDALEHSVYADNTIIIATSDHGYHMGEKEYLFKNSLWEESTRIPLVIVPPGNPTPYEVEQPVSLIDLYPTLIDYCALPGDPNQTTHGIALDGHSLVPLLKSPEAMGWEGPGFALTNVAYGKGYRAGEVGIKELQYYTIRTQDYRYILHPNGEEELYDHQKDDLERFNVADQESYRQVKVGLAKKLRNMIKL